MADTTHTRRQAQAIARREQLIRTGLQLFSEKGYRGASVRDIARAAGVTEGLLYHYFESKAALFRAILDQYAPVSAFEDLLRAAANPHPAQRSFDEALRALGRDVFARVREYRAFIVAMLTEAPSDPELGAILSDFLRSTNVDIARFLAEYRKVGQIDAQIPIDAAACVLQGSLMFYALLEAVRPQSAPAEADDSLDNLFTVLLAGLAPRQTR